MAIHIAEYLLFQYLNLQTYTENCIQFGINTQQRYVLNASKSNEILKRGSPAMKIAFSQYSINYYCININH